MSYKHEDDSGLLPCPFCGGEAETHPTYDMDTNEVDGYFAWCNNDKCECKPETREYLTEAEAIEAWNNRAQTVFGLTLDEVRQMIKRDAERERTCENVDTDDDCYFECSKCGSATLVEYKSGGYGVPNYCPNCGAKVVS